MNGETTKKKMGENSDGEEEEEDEEEWTEEDILGEPIPPTYCFFCNKVVILIYIYSLYHIYSNRNFYMMLEFNIKPHLH